MTTYQSQAVTTKDRDGNELTFKTLNIEGEEAVLAAAVDVELPDGQQVTVNVLYDESDVCGLIGYLHDNFGGRGVKPATIATAGQVVGFDMSGMPVVGKEVWDAARTDTVDPAIPTFTSSENGPVLNFGGQTYEPHTVSEEDLAAHQAGFEVAGIDYQTGGRQCPVIYDGVQCAGPEGHAGDHGFVRHDNPGPFPQTAVLPQNDAGTATPPADAQGAVNTPQPVLPGQSAAESATGAGTPEAAPASQPTAEAAKPKRKRRTKLEIAYDAALATLQTVPQGGEDWNDAMTAMNSARDALRAKDPGNSRLAESIAAVQNSEDALVGDWNASQDPGPSFAPEQPSAAGPWTQRPDGAAEFNVLTAAGRVPTFAPGQTQQLGQVTVTVTSEEQQAAQGFPCPVRSSDNRLCQRPYGHELLTQTNPEPKPHVYATADPSQLGQPVTPSQNFDTMTQPAPVTDPLPWTPADQGAPWPPHPNGFQPVGHADPVPGPLSFQIPPTPDAAPHPETNLQPPAPAAPSWSAPV